MFKSKEELMAYYEEACEEFREMIIGDNDWDPNYYGYQVACDDLMEKLIDEYPEFF